MHWFCCWSCFVCLFDWFCWWWFFSIQLLSARVKWWGLESAWEVFLFLTIFDTAGFLWQAVFLSLPFYFLSCICLYQCLIPEDYLNTSEGTDQCKRVLCIHKCKKSNFTFCLLFCWTQSFSSLAKEVFWDS